ncbi:MAG: hypothetical protein A2201_01055 [Alicyclobacillus sp. RIFOXYA1_FULL_53_8]|nr:MAG: hypothetical protein A2201_01055 [Alicyclobacillus sp. RIFOXYA1_FULL_53_8]
MVVSKWTDLFRSHEGRFYDYLVDHTQVTLAGLRLLYRFMAEGDAGPEHSLITSMSALEKQWDAIRRQLIDDLLSTFVTPIDREDLYDLSRCIDNVLDYADSTVKELVVYQIEATPEMLEMVKVLEEAAQNLNEAIAHMKDNVKLALEHLIAAKKHENQIETIYRLANAKLFDSTDVHYIFKVREVYRHLSNAADKLDEAADVMGSILIKGNV